MVHPILATLVKCSVLALLGFCLHMNHFIHTNDPSMIRKLTGDAFT